MPEYIEEKRDVLYQLGVELEGDELEHILQLQTEIAVDQYARVLIKRKWEGIE